MGGEKSTSTFPAVETIHRLNKPERNLRAIDKTHPHNGHWMSCSYFVLSKRGYAPGKLTESSFPALQGYAGEVNKVYLIHYF